MGPLHFSSDSPVLAARPRIAHVAVAMSATIVCALCLLPTSFRLPTSDWLRAVSDFEMFEATVAGAIAAGLILLPRRKLKLYWAAILGPLLSFPLSTAFVAILAFLT